MRIPFRLNMSICIVIHYTTDVRYIFTVDTYAAVFLKLDGVLYSNEPFIKVKCVINVNL